MFNTKLFTALCELALHLLISSDLLKKSLMENFIRYALEKVCSSATIFLHWCTEKFTEKCLESILCKSEQLVSSPPPPPPPPKESVRRKRCSENMQQIYWKNPCLSVEEIYPRNYFLADKKLSTINHNVFKILFSII